MPEANGKRNFALLALAILALAVILRVFAFSLFDTIHHDEILQYQERAWRMVFGEGIVPWEQRYGIRNSLIPQLMAGPMWLAAALGADGYGPLLAARWVFALACLGIVPAAYFIGSIASRTHGIVAMAVAAIWFEAVIFGVSALSEAIAAAFALGGTAAMLRARDSAKMAYLAGFLFALTALARFQYAAYAGLLVILIAQGSAITWGRVFVGAVPALALGAVSDLAAGQMPYVWMFRNFAMNLAEGRASSYGISGPFEYIRFFLIRAFPAGLAVLVLAFFSGKRYRPVLWSAVALVFLHSLIEHKEYRFIHVSVMALTILAAIGSVEAMKLMRKAESLNIATVASLCAGWALLSLFAYSKSGGEAALRDGKALATFAAEAAGRPETCGVATAEDERKDLATVYMPRRMPIFLFPNPMNKGEQSFAPSALAAFNAMVVTGDAKPPEGWREEACETETEADTGKPKRLCLYLRDGGCDVSRDGAKYRYQQYLRDRDW